MKKSLLFLFLCFLCLISNVFSQTYTMLSSATYITCSGDFYDAGGGNQDYPQNQNVIVTFLPTDINNDKLSVIFSSIIIEFGDTLFVYNGNNANAPLLAALTGNLIGTITSTASDGSLTFKFISDGTNSMITSQGGWSASFACNYTPDPVTMIAPGTYNICSGDFYDAGGSNQDYPQNQNVTTTFLPINTSTNKLSVMFSSIIIELGDTLFVYNGNNANAPLLAAFTGNLIGTITSTACDGSLTFKYISDATNNVITSNGGWVATISCNTVTPFSVTYSQININCNGANNGSIDLSVSGGITPYSYLWSNTATTQDINGLSAGTYSVTVTDANGCTKTTSVNITQPTVLTEFISSQTNVGCNGGSNGSATVTATGGTSPYNYLWSTGTTSSTISNRPIGTYTVTVTDFNGCTSSTSVTITQPTQLSSTITTISNAICNGYNDGSATVGASGGTSPYSYQWSNGQTTATSINLPAGNFTVTVTDNNGCTTNSSVTISQPSAIILTMIADSITCNGGNDGMATVSASNGVSPYSYQWSNAQTNDTIFNLTTGNYYVTVTGNDGCSNVSTIMVSSPAAISISFTKSDVSCNGYSDGSATVITNGGTPEYFYLWSNSENTATISGLLSGTYIVTVSDINSCSNINSVLIAQPAVLTANAGTDKSVCQGNAVIIGGSPSASGGTTPYTYSWLPTTGLNNASSANPLAAPQNVTSYTLTITDINGCPAIASSVTVSVNTNPAPTISANGATTFCQGNSVTLIADTAVSYLWSNNATTQSITVSTSGNYNVTVTDTNDCTGSSNTTSITVSPSYNTMETVMICSDDSIFLQGNYQTTAGTYYDTLLSANSCDSVIATILTINSTYITPATVTICSGDSIFLQGNYQTIMGNYYDTLATVKGCDSVVVTNLIVKDETIFSQTLTLCAGESITVGANTYNTSGTYTDILTASNGCDSTVITNLTVENNIDVTVSANGATLTANTSNAIYQWIDCDNGNTSIPNATNQSYTATVNGNYAVIIIKNSCSDTSACINVSGLDVGLSIKENVKFMIYPNPTGGNFTVEISYEIRKNYEIQIFDAKGGLVYQSEINSKIEIPSKNWMKGNYFVNLVLEGKLIDTKRVAVE